MERVKVVDVDSSARGKIVFNNGIELTSDHESDCCESHYLDLEHLSLSDFEELEFDISNDKFFNKIDGYGIELVPIRGHVVRIPGYGFNNGYYSTELLLKLVGKNFKKVYDITECQIISD